MLLCCVYHEIGNCLRKSAESRKEADKTSVPNFVENEDDDIPVYPSSAPPSAIRQDFWKANYFCSFNHHQLPINKLFAPNSSTIFNVLMI